MQSIHFETPDKRLSVIALVCESVSLLVYIASAVIAFGVIHTDPKIELVLSLVGIVLLLGGAVLILISNSRKTGSSKMNKISTAFVVICAVIVLAKIFSGV
ncbi:MAG TPA: hypothetical protein O0X97_00215 [Methanocorpusculum sp.]|nr:hypothetical protein [Methanocorpusculum sp.]